MQTAQIYGDRLGHIWWCESCKVGDNGPFSYVEASAAAFEHDRVKHPRA